jgi:hypothetical protein
MQNLHNHPRMWQVDSLAEMFSCLNLHPDALIIVWPRPWLADKPWAEMAASLSVANAHPRIPLFQPTDVAATFKAELAKEGVISSHPLYQWMLDDFGAAHAAGLAFFGPRLVWDKRLNYGLLNVDSGGTEHNARNDAGKVNRFHNDLTDYRLSCTYAGNRATLYIAPESVEAWVPDQSTDYPIWLAQLKPDALVYEMPLQAMVLYRGGPDPDYRPYYKVRNYQHNMLDRLPHAAPTISPDDASVRVYPASNYYLLD